LGFNNYHDFLIVAGDVEKDQDSLVRRFSIQIFDSPVGQGEKKEIVSVPYDLAQRFRFFENRDLDEDVQAQMEL